MPDNSTAERKAAMTAYGAELILVSKEEGMEGARDLALKMQAEGRGKVLDQFANGDNPEAHYNSTGPELWRQTHGSIEQPKISLIYTPIEQLSLYGNWGRTFQIGTGAAAYKVPPRTSDLSPSINDGWETGIKFSPAHWIDGRIGVAKSDSWIDMSTLESALRDDLDEKAPRATAVLRPLKLIIDNFPDNDSVECSAPVHPHHPDRGNRTFQISKELWIEAEDFMEVPSKGYFRLYPGNKVRLRYGYVVECTGCDNDENGNVIAVRCTYFADSKSGTEGSANYKVKGNIHWVSAKHAVEAEVRLYDRLFTDPNPDAGGKDFKLALNAHSKEVITAYLEHGMSNAQPDDKFQFERHGYFVVDRVDSTAGKLVFNRAVTLKDSWGK